MGASVQIKNIRNDYVKAIQPESLKAFVDGSQTLLQRQASEVSAIIRRDPTKFDRLSQAYMQTLEGAKAAIPLAAFEPLKKEVEKQFALERVRGLVDRGEYQRAKRAVLEDHASVFGLDPKNPNEREKLLDEIDQTRMRNLDIALKEEQRRTVFAERQRKDLREKNAGELFAQIGEASSPAARRGIRETALGMLSKKLIDMDDYKAIESITTKFVEKDSADLAFDLQTRIFDGDSTARLRDEIVMRHNLEELSSKDAEQLLGLLQQRKNRDKEKADPYLKERMRIAKEHLDTAFGKQSPFLPQNPKLRALQNNAEAYWADQVFKNNVDPIKAARDAALKYGGGSVSIPASKYLGSSQYTYDGIKEAYTKTLPAKLKSGQITMRQYQEAIQELYPHLMWHQSQQKVEQMLESEKPMEAKKQ